MLRRLYILLCCISSLASMGQHTVWAEEFENNCAFGCYASAYVGPNGLWTVTNGTNGTCPNRWFISCTENGNVVGACGTGCGNSETLHVANDIACGSPNACFFCPTGDCGAAYDAGCPPALCSFCCSCLTSTTDQRAESPTINLTGFSTLTLTFKYMEGGQGATDNATLWYFDGAVWAQIADMAKTVVCAGQGTWTTYSIALPASANNNANVRIGFRWVNNNDGSGSDPSFAVDDVEVTIPYAPIGTGLIVNELSNGPSGSKEYVELLVVGPSCTDVDIRSIKVDDNNGTVYNGFGATLTGSGVSAGHIRFSNAAQWAAVPTGSIILIYNNSDLNALLPADDPSDTAPADKRYILPANHALLEGCSTSPNAITTSGYFTCTLGAGNWNYEGFRNTGDAAQTRDALGRYFHGISYGSNANSMNTGGLDLLRISTLDHTARVIYFNSGNFRMAANFTSAVVAGNETPGAPNNAANLAYIATIDCSLPIELIGFSVRALVDRVRAEWTTASETSNDHFILERSADGSVFDPIGSLPGESHSTIERRYALDDHDPLAEVSYYRLRQVDLDGTSTLSRAVAVQWSSGSGFNAALDMNGLLVVSGASGPGEWTVLDALGRVIDQGRFDASGILREVLAPPTSWPLVLVLRNEGQEQRGLLLPGAGSVY